MIDLQHSTDPKASSERQVDRNPKVSFPFQPPTLHSSILPSHTHAHHHSSPVSRNLPAQADPCTLDLQRELDPPPRQATDQTACFLPLTAESRTAGTQEDDFLLLLLDELSSPPPLESPRSSLPRRKQCRKGLDLLVLLARFEVLGLRYTVDHIRRHIRKGRG